MRKFESTNTIGVCSIPGHVRTLYWHLQPNTKINTANLFVSIFQLQCTRNFSPLEPKHSLTHTELRRLFYGSREKLSDKNARNRSGDNRDYRSQQSNTEININITVPDTSCDMYCEWDWVVQQKYIRLERMLHSNAGNIIQIGVRATRNTARNGERESLPTINNSSHKTNQVPFQSTSTTMKFSCKKKCTYTNRKHIVEYFKSICRDPKIGGYKHLSKFNTMQCWRSCLPPL